VVGGRWALMVVGAAVHVARFNRKKEKEENVQDDPPGWFISAILFYLRLLVVICVLACRVFFYEIQSVRRDLLQV
jgi:hypothetical protein